MKSNWPAWVADWRSMIETIRFPDPGNELWEAGLQSLEAAEEFLAFIDTGRDQAR